MEEVRSFFMYRSETKRQPFRLSFLVSISDYHESDVIDRLNMFRLILEVFGDYT